MSPEPEPSVAGCPECHGLPLDEQAACDSRTCPYMAARPNTPSVAGREENTVPDTTTRCEGCGIPGYGPLCPVCAGEPCPPPPDAPRGKYAASTELTRLPDTRGVSWKQVVLGGLMHVATAINEVACAIREANRDR